MTDNIVLGTIFFLEFLLFYFLPVFSGKGTLFGFVISEDGDLGRVRKVLQTYRLGLIVIALIFVGLIITGISYFPNSLAVAYIFFGLAMSWWLCANLVKSWRLRKIEVFSKFATTLKPRRLKDYTNIWIELLIILFTVIPTVALIYFYPQLPEKIPVHWNAGGEADRWADKSILSVFSLPFLSIYIQAYLLLVKTDIVKARFRIPAENLEKILPLKEITHLANINLTDWSRLFIGVLFMVISFMLAAVITTEIVATALNIILWLSIVLLFVGIAYYIYQIHLANKQIKEITGQIVFQTLDEEKSWMSDGLFYKNDNDAAFFIEKPGGVGYTLNMANKRSYLYFAMIGGLILISLSAIAFI